MSRDTEAEYLAALADDQFAEVEAKIHRERAKRAGHDPAMLGTMPDREFEKMKNELFMREQRARAAKK